MPRIKDYSLLIDKNLVTEQEMPEPIGLLLYRKFNFKNMKQELEQFEETIKTMETYEQKYNEIVERIKELHAAGNSLTKKQMEIILPELAESEDERIIEQIKFAVMQMSSDREDTKKECLAWLEKQKEQKPVKWSKEDEELINYLSSVLQFVYEKDAHGLGLKAIDAEIWLKSLHPQPHWKPSKEQMGALNYAYCELFKRSDVEHNILGPLCKLIDELKKL